MQVGIVVPSSLAYWSPKELLKLKLHLSTQRSKSGWICCLDMHQRWKTHSVGPNLH